MADPSDDPAARPIQDQIAYYDARAGEYDEDMRRALAGQREVLDAQLRAFAARGRVLEVACGTGALTAELVPFANEITALDASTEMVELARARVTDPKVRFVHTDVFSWEPDPPYDAVVFGFWLSHVPPSHFDRFWEIVDACLARNGRVFFMDEGPNEEWKEDWIDERAGVVRRHLRDGSEHRAIKVLWDVEELRSTLWELGWDFEVGRAGWFYWGRGARRE
jgi:SAM-dependent methyltransferase